MWSCTSCSHWSCDCELPAVTGHVILIPVQSFVIWSLFPYSCGSCDHYLPAVAHQVIISSLHLLIMGSWALCSNDRELPLVTGHSTVTSLQLLVVWDHSVIGHVTMTPLQSLIMWSWAPYSHWSFDHDLPGGVGHDDKLLQSLVISSCNLRSLQLLGIWSWLPCNCCSCNLRSLQCLIMTSMQLLVMWSQIPAVFGHSIMTSLQLLVIWLWPPCSQRYWDNKTQGIHTSSSYNSWHTKMITYIIVISTWMSYHLHYTQPSAGVWPLPQYQSCDHSHTTHVYLQSHCHTRLLAQVLP